MFLTLICRSCSTVSPPPPLITGRQLYKHLLRQCERLPTDACKHYKFAVRQSFKQHRIEPDPERVRQIINKSIEDAKWVVKKSARGFTEKQPSKIIITDLDLTKIWVIVCKTDCHEADYNKKYICAPRSRDGGGGGVAWNLSSHRPNEFGLCLTRTLLATLDAIPTSDATLVHRNAERRELVLVVSIRGNDDGDVYLYDKSGVSL